MTVRRNPPREVHGELEETRAVLEDLYMEVVGEIPGRSGRLHAELADEHMLAAVAEKAPRHLPTLILLAEQLGIPPIVYDPRLRAEILELVQLDEPGRAWVISPEFVRWDSGSVWLVDDAVEVRVDGKLRGRYSLAAWRRGEGLVEIPTKYTVTAQHIDTCFVDFLQDHHNRDGEMLLGVSVSEGMSADDVIEDLMREVHSSMDDEIPEEVTDEQLHAAFTAAVLPNYTPNQWGLEAIWDADQIAANNEQGDVPSHWFVLTWEREDEE